MASTSVTAEAANTALVPLRLQTGCSAGADHASAVAEPRVGLLVMQVGAYLVPAWAHRPRCWPIVAGSVLGAGLLAVAARIGCESGLSSAVLMHATYGRQLCAPAGAAHIVQLVG